MSLRRVYVDANVFIYLLEGSDNRQTQASRALHALLTTGRRLVISELVIAECIYGALKSGRPGLERLYLDLFSADESFDLADINGGILLAAARHGPKLGLKLLDAVHFHAAQSSRCDEFLTNDAAFQNGHGIDILQLRTFETYK
jgi:predicted nucleic acid-binding protein